MRSSLFWGSYVFRNIGPEVDLRLYASLIFGPILLIGGVLVGLHGAQGAAVARETESWPATSAIVVRNTTDARGAPILMYRYRADGAMREGFAVNLGHGMLIGRVDTAALRERYPEGARVTAYRHPGRPDIAVLEPGLSGRIYEVIAVGSLLTLAGVGLLVLAWRRHRMGY